MSGILSIGSIVDPAARLSEASESRAAVILSTIDSLHCDPFRDAPADSRLAAERRYAADPHAPSAGSGVIVPFPAPDNVVLPPRAERGGLVEVAGAASGISVIGSFIDRAERRSDARESSPPVAPSTIDSLLRDLSRDPPADTRLAAELRSAVEAVVVGPSIIGLSPGPSSVAPAADSSALQPAAVEDPILKELGIVLARLDAEKSPKPRFFR